MWADFRHTKDLGNTKQTEVVGTVMHISLNHITTTSDSDQGRTIHISSCVLM